MEETSTAKQTNHSPSIEIDIEETPAPLEEVKSGGSGSQTIQERTIFGFLALSICVFAVLIAIVHLTVYLLGYGWQRNPMSLALGLEEKFEESRTPNLAINFHALAGITSVGLMTFQVISGFRMVLSSPGEISSSWARKLHRFNGRFVAMLWFVTAILGFVFLHISDRHKTLSETLSPIANTYKYVVFYSVGIGTIVNLGVGLDAVLNHEKKDMLLHKGSMFFSLYWILGSALDELVIVFVQLQLRDCSLGAGGVIICATAGESMQLALITSLGYSSAPDAFRRRFVTRNLMALGLRTILFILASVYTLAVPPEDDTCLGTLN